MPQHQLVGLGLLVLAVIDTAVGHLMIVPRVADEQKRTILKVAFAVSGLCIAGLGLVVYQGLIPL